MCVCFIACDDSERCCESIDVVSHVTACSCISRIGVESAFSRPLLQECFQTVSELLLVPLVGYSQVWELPSRSQHSIGGCKSMLQ